MTSSSHTPPAPKPVVGTQNEPPLPSLHRSVLREREQTERLPVDDEDRTRPFVKRKEVLGRGSSGDRIPTLPAWEEGDDLCFDRPLFVPRPLPALPPEPARPDTSEAIDLDGYERLIAATRERASGNKEKPTPPWPVDVPAPETLFNQAETDDALGFDPSDPEMELMIEEPSPPPLIFPFPMEATQPPGVSPPSVAAVACRPLRRLWIAIGAAAVLGAVGVGVLAGVLLRRLSLPQPASRPPQAAKATTLPTPRVLPARGVARRRPTRPPSVSTAEILARARTAERLEEHTRAFELYRQVLARDPTNVEATLGRARCGVVIGRDEGLVLLEATPSVPGRDRLLPGLRIQLALARREWRKAWRLLQRLPRARRYQPRGMVWMALVWRGIGRTEDARYALQQVLRDPRLRDDRLRLEALLRLSEVQLERRHLEDAVGRARAAAEIARRLGSTALLARVEQQVARCQIALGR